MLYEIIYNLDDETIGVCDTEEEAYELMYEHVLTISEDFQNEVKYTIKEHDESIH